MTDYKNLKLIATSSPHIRAAENTRSIMLDVIIAMMPALIWAIENITKGTDPDFNVSASAAAYGKTRSGAPGMEILPNAPIKLKMGRFGNIIYGTTAEEK